MWKQREWEGGEGQCDCINRAETWCAEDASPTVPANNLLTSCTNLNTQAVTR